MNNLNLGNENISNRRLIAFYITMKIYPVIMTALIYYSIITPMEFMNDAFNDYLKEENIIELRVKI